jgi:undecaprenyl-diphosphatase
MSQAKSRTRRGLATEAGPLGRVDADKRTPRQAVQRPHVPAATITVLAGFVGLAASLFVFGSIADGVRQGEVFALDKWANPFLHGLGSVQIDALMNTLTTIGSSLVIVPLFIAAVAFLVWQRRYGAAVFLGLATGGALALETTMKIIFERPRPRLAWARVLPDYSFPSGHTMNSVVFYVAIAVVVWSILGRRIGLVAFTVAIVLALGVGVSRIYLGYHYLTDVVGGLMAGTAWLLVVGAAFRARPSWWTWGTVKREIRKRSGRAPAA